MIGDFTYENSYNESTQIIAYNLIKIFKFLCEEHNNFFQEKILTKLSYKYLQWQKMEYNNNGILLTERATEETSMTFFNFMINILNKICLITNKAKEEAHVGFYYDLIYGILELLVEIIQGNKKEIIINSKLNPLTLSFFRIKVYYYFSFLLSFLYSFHTLLNKIY